MPEYKTSGKTFSEWGTLILELKKEKILAFPPGEREYELSTATANLLYRFTRPHFVIQPETWGEVLVIVDRTYALKLHEVLTVKGGGHSFTGFSTVDKGILVDMKRMTGVELVMTEDETPKPAIVKVKAGARWGDVYRSLIRTDCRGYVVNGGRCPSVGVGGFLLGGGLGPFGRTLGVGSDTMLGATIITLKDKKAVKLDVDENNDKELFWALRGGGTAAFGIVTEFRLKVCKLKNADVDKGVAACRYKWSPNFTWKKIQYDGIADEKERQEAMARREAVKKEENEAVLKTMKAFYAAKWPDTMTIDSNWMYEMNGDTGKLGIRFTVYFDGPRKDAQELFEKHIKDKDLKEALKLRTIPEPTTRFLHETLFLMWEEEAKLTLPRVSENSYQLWCSFVFTDDADKMAKVIGLSMEEQDQFEKDFKNDDAALWITFIHSGGEMMTVGNETSAYPWREGVFQCHLTVKWGEKWLEIRAREAILRIKKKLSEHSLIFEGQCASYINFSDATLAVRGDPEKAYYGSNLQRLKKLKQERDPNNHFRWPWQTDTQPWRDPEPWQDSDEKNSTEHANIAAIAEKWTDLIARKDWTTYDLPPPSYTELYAPDYLQSFYEPNAAL